MSISNLGGLTFLPREFTLSKSRAALTRALPLNSRLGLSLPAL